MPGGKKESRSQRPEILTDSEAAGGVDDRKNYLVSDPETGVTKEIRPRLRSGANRDSSVNA